MLDDRRFMIRIRNHASNLWIRIQEAQKHTDPTDPNLDPQHCCIGEYLGSHRSSYLPSAVVRNKLFSKTNLLPNQVKLTNFRKYYFPVNQPWYDDECMVSNAVSIDCICLLREFAGSGSGSAGPACWWASRIWIH